MEKDIIYIAGNPSAYPLEYYDAETGQYEGMVPELLRRFSQQYPYDVRYYLPEKGDLRLSLAASQQVDIVSCPEDVAEVRHRSGEDILLLENDGTGRPAVLSLLDVAPSALSGDLRAFVAAVGQQELTGMALQTVRSAPPQNRAALRWTFGGMLLIIAVLLALLAAAILSSRRKLRKLQLEKALDPVTGVGNREYLEQCFQDRLNLRNRVLYSAFCFYFDPAAVPSGEDEAAFPRRIASVLKECAAEPGFLARPADNTFVCLRLTTGEGESTQWLTAALDRIRQQPEGSAPVPPVSVGVYPLKSDDRELSSVLFKALRTAQAAQQSGQDYQFFQPGILRALQEEQQLREDARPALQNREFQLYLQFCAEARTGKAAGAEVLVQWDHPTKGLLPASRWRTILEQEGLAAQLDDYVLERSCACLDHLRQNGKEDFFLLCRLSAQTLASGTLAEQWKDMLEAYHFDRRHLILAAPQSLDAANPAAEAIRSMELGLVLDDFSGDLSSLSHAHDLQFRGVKLSREFASLAETPSGRTVLEALFQAGHHLKLVFLAEDAAGKESLLRELGCDLLCGELPPLPLWEAMKKLSARKPGKEKVNP